MGRWVFSACFFAFMLLVITTEARAVDYKLTAIDGQLQPFEQAKGW